MEPLTQVRILAGLLFKIARNNLFKPSNQHLIMAEKLSREKYEEIVVDLAKKGLTNEKIGLIIKKEHKIVPRSYEKIGKVLKKHNLESKSDTINLKRKIDMLTKHSLVHKQDQTFRRSLSKKSAKLRKMESI